MRGDLPEWFAGWGPSTLPPPEFKTGEDLYDVLVDRLALDSSWVVISLNYDILFEQALERKGCAFRYVAVDSGWHSEAVEKSAVIEVLKPHGSVNWRPNDAFQVGYGGNIPEPSQIEIV